MTLHLVKPLHPQVSPQDDAMLDDLTPGHVYEVTAGTNDPADKAPDDADDLTDEDDDDDEFDDEDEDGEDDPEADDAKDDE